MREFLSILLVFMLVSPVSQAREKPNKQTPKEQITALKQGQSLEIKRLDGTKVRGRLGPVSENGFVVVTDQRAAGAKADVAFSDVKSIKLNPTGRTFKLFLVAAGVAVGVLLLAIFLQDVSES